MSIVLKVGGSLINESPDLLQYLKNEGISGLVIPGGGMFADLIRTVSHEYNLSDEAAHWMAIYGMSQYAYYLHDKTGITLTRSLEAPDELCILLPHPVLEVDQSIEHSWDNTSDTIAAWVAKYSGARLIKATNVDGIMSDGQLVREINASDLVLMGETCVDRGLPKYLLANGMTCIVVNGRHPDRVLAAIRGESTISTTIHGR